MSRVYLQSSWVDACADHSEWSGQSPDDRKRPSHFIGTAANIAAYAEKEEPVKAKKKADLRTTNEKNLSRLEMHRNAIEAEFSAGNISFERYKLLVAENELKIDRVFKRMERAGEIEPEIISIDSSFVIEKNNVNSFIKDFTFLFGGATILLTAAMYIF